MSKQKFENLLSEAVVSGADVSSEAVETVYKSAVASRDWRTAAAAIAHRAAPESLKNSLYTTKSVLVKKALIPSLDAEVVHKYLLKDPHPSLVIAASCFSDQEWFDDVITAALKKPTAGILGLVLSLPSDRYRFDWIEQLFRANIAVPSGHLANQNMLDYLFTQSVDVSLQLIDLMAELVSSGQDSAGKEYATKYGYNLLPALAYRFRDDLGIQRASRLSALLLTLEPDAKQQRYISDARWRLFAVQKYVATVLDHVYFSRPLPTWEDVPYEVKHDAFLTDSDEWTTYVVSAQKCVRPSPIVLSADASVEDFDLSSCPVPQLRTWLLEHPDMSSEELQSAFNNANISDMLRFMTEPGSDSRYRYSAEAGTLYTLLFEKAVEYGLTCDRFSYMSLSYDLANIAATAPDVPRFLCAALAYMNLHATKDAYYYESAVLHHLRVATKHAVDLREQLPVGLIVYAKVDHRFVSEEFTSVWESNSSWFINEVYSRGLQDVISPLLDSWASTRTVGELFSAAAVLVNQS